MRRYVIVGMFAAVLFGTVSALSADGKLYHLSKVPKFCVGDRAVAKETDVSGETVTIADGKVVSRKKTSEDARIVYEVTEVDKAGKIQAFRVSIISAKAKFDIALPAPDKKRIAIENIHFIARRKGLDFDADTTTVVSEKDKKLKASQIWLLKKHCRNGITFPMYQEEDALLMPTEPVPVGHKWKPSREMLDRWTEASSEAKKANGKAVSAEFRFVSVTDGVALIEGAFVVEATLAGKRVKMAARVIAKIDTGSGRWVGETLFGPIVLKMQGASVKIDSRSEDTASLTPGKGKVSALPKKIFKIGWKRPGKDTNNHIDKTKGFSLNVPAGYVARKAPLNESFIAKFVDKLGRGIVVTEDSTDYPVEIDEIVREFLASMRDDDDSPPGYTVIKREKVTLANGIPSVLITAKIHGGKAILLTVIAIDGERIMTVSTGAPTDMKDLLAELKKTLKTLRIFEPDYTKAPPEASGKP